MSSPGRNRLVLAAAGSRKTQRVIDEALAVRQGRVLIATFTNENQKQIIRRIEQSAGTMPAHVEVVGWFTFLLRELIKPYQRSVVGEPNRVAGLNFKGQRHRFTPKTDIAYFLDGNDAVYRDGVADLAMAITEKTNDAPLKRLERVFSHIFVDEVQDLAGYDLDILEKLFDSKLETLLVGDPRQATLRTNLGSRNKQYVGAAQPTWFEERKQKVEIEVASDCYRSNQAICDFADAIYPSMPRTCSKMSEATGHDGIFVVKAENVQSYAAQYQPVVLRWDRTADTQGLAAMNIGVSKGSTFDRTLIFPTGPMVKYLEDRDPTKLKAPEKLYVAITRSRFSTAFVVPDKFKGNLPSYTPPGVENDASSFF